MSKLSLKKLCCTCLSTERDLHQLCRVFDGVNLLYTLLMHDPEAFMEDLYKDTASLRVCWECAAILRRIKVFQVQACVVQKQLTAVVNHRNDVKPKTFSKLAITNTTSISIQQPNIEYQCNETPVDPLIDCGQIDEVKTEIDEVKTEIDSEQTDSADSFYEDDDDKDELLKTIDNDHNYYSQENILFSEDTLSVEDFSIKTEIQTSDSDIEENQPLQNVKKQQSVKSKQEIPQTIETNVKRTHETNMERAHETNVERAHETNVERAHETNAERTHETNVERSQTVEKNVQRSIKIPEKNANEVESNDNDEATIEKICKEHFAITIMDEYEMNKSVEERRKALNESGALRKCESCLLVFKRKSFMDAHNKEFHEKKLDTVQCDMCKRYVEDILTHKETHYHKYCCIWCEHVTYTHQDIIQHLKDIHKRIFHKRKALQNGLSPYTADYPCEECSESFISSRYLWMHVQKKHREGFKCKTCGKRFPFRHCLQIHEARIHTGLAPKKSCPVCNKEMRAASMSSHLRTHMERQTYACVACDKSFVSRETYESHMKFSKVHAGSDVSRYKCPICQKGHRYRHQLDDHINFQHKNLAVHKCDVCGKRFATKRGAIKHAKKAHDSTKGGEKDKIICTQCGKAFTNNTSFLEHELIHSGVRPLSCSICGRDFRQRAALYTHMRRVHKGMKK